LAFALAIKLSTWVGFVNPNSMIDAATWATWASVWVREFRSYGTSRSIGQISMFRAIAGVNLGSGMGEVTKRAGKCSKTLGNRTKLLRNQPFRRFFTSGSVRAGHPKS
jgi:hypothetical protein